MLVIQLTWGLFLLLMQAKYPGYTQEGLALMWKEYERDAGEMIGEDIRIDPTSAALAFNELSVFDFVEYEVNDENHRYFPADLRSMNDDEFAKVKKEIQTFLGAKFIGFTDLDRVVYRLR